MIPAPNPSLKVCVVVPAKDEEDLIPRCLASLARQSGVSPEEYEVLLVLDDCADATEERARLTASEHPELRLALLQGPGRGAGHARRAGMETACERLLDLDRPGGLIASTDADTIVAEDWLANQLAAAEGGARAIGGRIELLEEGGPPEEVLSWREKRGRQRLVPLRQREGRRVEHWQFSGASLSLTAEAYREIGGLEPRAALEDEYLERALQQRNIPIQRPLNVRVSTSPRLVGRASRGLAKDLSLASWLRRNTYREPLYSQTARSTTVSVVIPSETAPDCAPPSIQGVDLEMVLVPASGSRAPLAEDFGPVRGRGDALWRGVWESEGEIVALLPDASAEALQTVPFLLGPLLQRSDLGFVKGYPSDGNVPELSRLVGAPVINLHYPELSGFVDPLCGYAAARRELLRRLPFPVGSGVDASLLLDAARETGPDAIAQAALPPVSPHASSTEDSYAILAAMLARTTGEPADTTPGPLAIPAADGSGFDSRDVAVEERPPLREVMADSPHGELLSDTRNY